MPQAALARADRDGFDTPTDFAGALVDGSNLSRPEKLGMISSANLELVMPRVYQSMCGISCPPAPWEPTSPT